MGQKNLKELELICLAAHQSSHSQILFERLFEQSNFFVIRFLPPVVQWLLWRRLQLLIFVEVALMMMLLVLLLPWQWRRDDERREREKGQKEDEKAAGASLWALHSIHCKEERWEKGEWKDKARSLLP
jgi:hypothetical protein